jgi:hypothetical protein
MNQYTLLLNTINRSLEALLRILDKAEAHVKEKGIEESVLLNAALFPDMFNFTKQVQVATDDARRNLCLLAGKEHVRMEDTETTIVELKDRVKRTQDVVKSISLDDLKDADTRKISLYWMGEMYVEGKDFVNELAIANLLFHVVTAYDILRAQGVDIGKTDFIGNVSMKPKAQA